MNKIFGGKFSLEKYISLKKNIVEVSATKNEHERTIGGQFLLAS